MNKREEFRSNFRDLIVLSLFGGIMVISDQIMSALPNVHLIAMFIILLTRFYRAKALYAIYLFVIIDGLLEGFFLSTWVLYSYIWLILWVWVMLLPKKLSSRAELAIYPLIGALHGLTFGLLGSPASYLLFIPSSSWSLKNYGEYILAGLSFDMIHMASNFAVCMLVKPLIEMMRKFRKKGFL